MLSKRTIIIVHDLVMAALAWQLAWLARFNFEFPFHGWKTALALMPVIVAVQGAVYFWFRLYRGRWRYASVPDLWNIVRASLLGALCITLALFILFRLEEIPRSILILYPVLLVMCLGTPRLAYRFVKDRRMALDTTAAVKTCLIVGAGRAGDMLVREMLRDPQYFPAGFLDDRAELKNTELHGVRVLGPVKDIAAICRSIPVDFIVIAIPSATSEQMRRIVALCEEPGLPLRTLPGLGEMVAGAPVMTGLRNVAIEDLLGREKVELDWKTIESGLAGKSVLVSGGGGSVGSELCRQIARLAPDRLVVVDRSEFNLYRIRKELTQANPDLRLHAMLGDVCDPRTVEHLMKSHRPDVVFHAAAYKHVPMLQEHLREAVLNNVFGTLVLADAARRHGCGRFVLISTDKAVRPTSVLGITKRIAELVCETHNSRDGTRFVTVRFGNVLGSDGSVVPLFEEQIRNGGPVTVTHPEVMRYFMTAREACELILQAGAMGQGGEVFVLDMGEPVRIMYLAEQMIRLSGFVPEQDVRIEFTGLRAGEKLREELFHRHEQRETTVHPKIFLARHPEIDVAALNAGLAQLREYCDRFDEEAIRGLLRDLAGDGALRVSSGAKVVPITPAGSQP
jgi:FlaA1/EpsC-like NDP-sugar epimerase